MRRRKVFKPFVTPDKEAEALVREIQQLSEWYVEEQKTTLARLEIKQNEYRVLAAVIEGKVVKLSQVAKVLGQSEGQASKMVKSLGNGGWLIVSRGEKDGREAQVAASQAGQEMFAQCKLRIRSMVQWPLWGERGEGPKKILAALRDLNEQIAASRVRLEFGDPDHDKMAGRWPKKGRIGRGGASRWGSNG